MGTGINQILNQGKAALSANQSGLATTSHNIANVNTEGFSRQRVEMHSEDPINQGKHRIGGGVKVGAITRAHSDFLGKRIEEEHTQLGRYEGMAGIYGQIEAVFKDDAEQGISRSVSKFFNDVRTLSTQPESTALRTAVRESAETVTSRFREVANSVDAVVQDLNRRVEGDVSEINALTKKIALLNQRVVQAEVGGGFANDERDQRDVALQKLAKIVDVQSTALENGAVSVMAGRLGVLVNANESFDLRTQHGGGGGSNPGATRVLLATSIDGKTDRDLTDFVEAGSLGGYLHMRDKDIPSLMSKIDTLAHGLTGQVNSIHQNSFGRNGQKGSNFFEDSGNVEGAASRLSLSAAVKKDLANIATAEIPNAAGDNRALLKIADLQDKHFFEDGRANFTDYASSIIGSLGVEARAANDNLENQRGVMDQLGTMREQLSGVSLDEEAMNMLKYQKAFDASAKMIQTADSMLETVLNLKRF